MIFNALIVSNDGLVERFSEILRSVGVTAHCILQADDALPLLTSRAYAAVLLDCDLDDSLDLIQIIRNEQINQRSVILAFATKEDVLNRARRSGATFVLSKPIDRRLAERTIRAARGMIIRDRRSCIRAETRGPAKLRTDEGSLDALLFDLSDEGAAIKIPTAISCGTEVRLEFAVPAAGNKVVECAGKVAWCSGNLAGITFSEIPILSAKMIAGWVNHRYRATRGLPNRSLWTQFAAHA
jgi:CheY-like chemotaxis protein